MMVHEKEPVFDRLNYVKPQFEDPPEPSAPLKVKREELDDFLKRNIDVHIKQKESKIKKLKDQEDEKL